MDDASSIANGNVYMYPLGGQLPRPPFVPRGTGTALDPMVVEHLGPEQAPVRDIFKGIDRRMKHWLRTNTNMEYYYTWNRAGTVRTTTYTNVDIVITDGIDVIVIDE